MKNSGEIFYPDRRTLLFTFSFRSAGYACILNKERCECRRIQWNLWRGFFCPDEEIPDEILEICNRLLTAGNQNPEKYRLAGEHYLISLTHEGTWKIGFARGRMLSGDRYRIPTVLRLFFALLLSLGICCLFFEKSADWLNYLLPNAYRYADVSEAALCAVSALETAALFFLFGKNRSLAALYLDACFSVGSIILLGAMKKYFVLALAVPPLIVLAYALFRWFSASEGESKTFRFDRGSLHNALVCVVSLVAAILLFFDITPRSMRDAYEKPEISAELAERYEWACAELGVFQQKSPEEKLAVLQAICDYECLVGFGCTPPQIRAERINDDVTGGYYVNETETVIIREEYLTERSAESALKVTLHELRHHMQSRMAEIYCSLSPYIRDEYRNTAFFRDAAAFMNNFKDYHHLEDDVELYQNQPVEVDSRAWSEEKIKQYLPLIYGGESGADAEAE